MIWMGLDLGERRIGVALSDSLGMIARPHATIEVGKAGELPIRELLRLIEEHDVEGVVVGLPKRLDGTRGSAARAVESSAAELRAALPVPVVLWDERLTSVEAERLLVEAGVRRRRRREKGLTDRVAAALILQSWLDRRAADAGGRRVGEGVER